MRWLVLSGFVLASAAFAQGEEFNPPPSSSTTPPAVTPEHQRVPRARVSQRQSDAPTLRLTRITVGPMLLLFGQLPVEYDRGVTPDMSFFVGLRAVFPSVLALVGEVIYGGAATFGLRFFPMDAPAPSGLWLGVETEAGYHWKTTALAPTTRIFDVHAAAIGGFTYIAGNGFTVSTGLGLGMGYTTMGVFGPGPGLIPRLTMHLNAGYAY